MILLHRFLKCIGGRLVIVLFMAGLMLDSSSAQQNPGASDSRPWALALHGGAGGRSRETAPEENEALEKSLQRALAAGKDVLAAGGAALDAVQTVVVALEDDPRFNAGRGAVFNRAGEHELDASIMDGNNLRCGAVASVKFQKNPIEAARLVMERTPHILMAGERADAFALENGCERAAQNYFYTERRFGDLQRALAKAGLEPLEKPAYELPGPAAGEDGGPEGGHGTVGCVALDMQGNLAAATSTGGLTAKMPGRIGDTPIIGAGTYASNQSCAVSGTGKGEEFIRHSVAAQVAWLMEQGQLSVDEAVRQCLNEVLQPGDGGIIALDSQGIVSMRATTEAMPRGVADSTGRFETAIWIDR